VPCAFVYPTRFPESAPLLADQHDDDHSPDDSFSGRLGDMLHEPLTPLNKFLFILVLFFLILSSVFIGLFAGAETRLNKAPHDGPVVTVTSVSPPLTVTKTVELPAPTSPPEEPIEVRARREAIDAH
jgi:endothelin-converting enzyme